MPFEIDAFFESNLLTASIIPSLDIDLKEKLSVPQFSLLNLLFPSFEIYVMIYKYMIYNVNLLIESSERNMLRKTWQLLLRKAS